MFGQEVLDVFLSHDGLAQVKQVVKELSPKPVDFEQLDLEESKRKVKRKRRVRGDCDTVEHCKGGENIGNQVKDRCNTVAFD